MRWLPHSLAPTPDVGETLVWLVRDTDTLLKWVANSDVLSESEQARAANIRHPIAKLQFARGRTILRSALALWLDELPAQVPILLTPDGKPFVDSPAVHFNMSHTSGFALYAISGRPIGVDIETVDPKRDCDGLMRRFFTPVEQEQYFRLEQEHRPAAFLRGWTCKEALLKAIGSGVRDLQNCSVNLDPNQPPAVLLAPGDSNWTLHAGEVEPGVAWAVAQTHLPP
jgi:4'-phosphopantetheinyl transferase